MEDDINIQILWPKQEQIQENILNNNSIVFKFNYKYFSMLFTGDIEEVAEKQILKEYADLNILKSNILKVAHHRFQNIKYARVYRKSKSSDCIDRSWRK